jgi:hypothetical protein
VASQGDAAFAERKAPIIEIDAGDVLACGGILPERVAPRTSVGEKLEILSSKFEAEGGTGAAQGAWIPGGDGTGADGGGLVNAFGPSDSGDCTDHTANCTGLAGESQSGAGESIPVSRSASGAGDDLTTVDDGAHPKNDTNEAKCDDDVSTLELQEIDRLVSEIDDYFGLDTQQTKPKSGGGASISVSRPPPDGDRGGTAPPGREAKILEMEQWLFQEIETLKSQGEATGQLFNDMMAASANLHAYLKTYHSRSP